MFYIYTTVTNLCFVAMGKIRVKIIRLPLHYAVKGANLSSLVSKKVGWFFFHQQLVCCQYTEAGVFVPAPQDAVVFMSPG